MILVDGAQLVKLMKRANCRLRTPSKIYNPRIEADGKELRERFADAAREKPASARRTFLSQEEA